MAKRTVDIEWRGKVLKIEGVDVSAACRSVAIATDGPGHAVVTLELYADFGGVVVESERK
jgi:hypothetical protein